MSHFDMSTTARAKRKARQGRDYVEMPIGLTCAMVLFGCCVLGLAAVVARLVVVLW